MNDYVVDVPNSYVFTTFVSLAEPKNIGDALKDPEWVLAMQEELN